MNRVDVTEVVGRRAAPSGAPWVGALQVSASPLGSDRRAFGRLECNVRFQGGGGSRCLHGRIEDLSPSGLRLRTFETLPVGGQLYLEFELPTGKVEAVGEVRDTQLGHGLVGIRFLRIDCDSANALAGACARH